MESNHTWVVGGREGLEGLSVMKREVGEPECY